MTHSAPPSLAAVEAVCDSACALVRELLTQPLDSRNKADHSPVTAIDLAIDAFLHRQLRPLMPSAGWLSEETADQPDRLSNPWLWVVDPIDGTRSLIAGKPEFCVSIALVHAGEGPVLGVIGNPSTRERWSAHKGQGAHDQIGRRLQVRTTPPADPIDLLVSRSDARLGLWDDVPGHPDFRRVGSLAYKMALVAAGQCDGHATPTPRSEWDAAAGELLISEAGGATSDLHGQALRFNQPRPQYDGFVVASRASFPRVLELARAAHRRWQTLTRSGTDPRPT